MSRTQHFLDCGCQNCVNQLLEDIEKLEAEIAKLREGKESLEWFVSLLADIFNYNEYQIIQPVDITIWLNTVINTANFTKEDYKKIHVQILKAGLTTLPNSNKAIKALKGESDGSAKD